METWTKYEAIDITIERITQFTGGDHECTIFFEDNQGREGKLFFPSVFDFRYAIEEAFLGREAIAERGELLCFIRVKDSEYIKYFEYQVCGTRPVDKMNIMHFILFDHLDTGIEIIASEDPALAWIGVGDAPNSIG
jgi:hypothetical protein